MANRWLFGALAVVAAGCANGTGDGLGSASEAISDNSSGTARFSRNTIVYQSLRGATDDIYAINANGGRPFRVTSDAAVEASPFLSPDRSHVAFSSNRDGNNEIYVSDTQGENVLRLTNNTTLDFHPVFSHDGNRVFFQRQTGGLFDIWVMDADGANQHRVTFLPLNEVGAQLSPDDQRMAFMGNNGGNQDVWVANADGTGIVNITQGTCTNATVGQTPCVLARDQQPYWTPDGQIVFVSDRSGFNEIWVSNADGSAPRQVTNLHANSGLPSVSHNGEQVAFVSNAHNTASGVRSVYVVNFDGSDARRLTFDPSDELTPRFAY